MIIDTAIREQPNIVQRQMMASGELDRMRELLRARLAECGWKDQMVLLCRKVVAENDINTLTVDDILDKITPQGRALVPDTVKKELLQKIKTYLMEEANLTTPASRSFRHRS
ncbi:UNVERIFIED_CONTAM: hypothetical protein PYX00_006609 [Menopon gallinae]|uniref:Enhancer of yellow 2 transcription factor n=1 Tax=Menopon gallinae TaxID=328185 RepID=A0AAW2HWE6_9NEOP